MANPITRMAGRYLKGMNRQRWVTGFVLFFVLFAVVILVLGFAHTWALPRTEGQASRCFVDFAHSKSPMWLGCVMATHETLAGGLIAAAGALFGAWLAFSGLKEQIGLEQENIRILQRAYISVEPLGIEPFYSARGAPDNVVGHVQCRNVGHLPARDFQMSAVKMKWVSNDLIENEIPGDVGTERFKLAVPVQAKVPAGTADRLSPEELQQIENRNGYLLVWGKVTYMDGLGCPRFVKFCHRYPCVRRAGDRESGYKIGTEHARYHQHGNDQD